MRPTARPPLLDNASATVTRRRAGKPRTDTTQPSPSGDRARRSVLQTTERHYQLLLPRPFLTTSCRQQGPFARRALPRVSTTTDPSATCSSHLPLPSNTGYRQGLLQGLSPWDETGFSSCSVCSCLRAAGPTPPMCPNAPASLRQAMQPSPPFLRLGHRVSAVFEATCPFACAAARRLARHPIDDFVERLQLTRFPSWLLSKLRGVWLLPRWD